MKRRMLWAGAAIIVVYLAVSVASGVALAAFSLHRQRNRLNATLVDLAHQRAQSIGAVLDDVSVTAPDGAVLRGWFGHTPKWNGRTVVLLHGVTDNRLGVSGYAEFLLRNGFNVLLPDARAHGESDGTLASYGLKEAPDVHTWVDWLEETHPAACVYGLGESMGAAILLQSLAYEHRFCAVVAESAFSDFEEAAFDRVGEKFGQGPWLGETVFRPAIDIALFYARERFGLDFDNASPRKAVMSSTVPVLLIHGLNDVNIRPRNSERIKAAAPDHVRLWEVAGAAHCGAWSTAPREFERRLLAWFQIAHPLTPATDRLTTIQSGGRRTL